jgi:hypothetical protein
MKGGLPGTERMNKEESELVAFKRFTSNLDEISIFPNQGDFGLIMKFTNNRDFVYKSMDVGTYGVWVKTILVKFIPIHFDEEAFVNEVNIQKDIYEKTKDVLEPLCPAILFDHICTIGNQEDKELLNYIPYNKLYKFENVNKIGIIAMELAKYETIDSFLKKPQNLHYKDKVFAAALFLIIELAHKTEYTQGDFHLNNILVKVEDSAYPYFVQDELGFNPFKIKPLFIDFGLAKKLDLPTMKKINDCYNNQMFKNIMCIICEQGSRVDKDVILRRTRTYGWASGLSNFEEKSSELTKIIKKYKSNNFNLFTRRSNVTIPFVDTLCFFRWGNYFNENELRELNLQFNDIIHNLIEGRKKSIEKIKRGFGLDSTLEEVPELQKIPETPQDVFGPTQRENHNKIKYDKNNDGDLYDLSLDDDNSVVPQTSENVAKKSSASATNNSPIVISKLSDFKYLDEKGAPEVIKITERLGSPIEVNSKVENGAPEVIKITERLGSPIEVNSSMVRRPIRPKPPTGETYTRPTKKRGMFSRFSSGLMRLLARGSAGGTKKHRRKRTRGIRLIKRGTKCR